jgi:hypothetical protein
MPFANLPSSPGFVAPQAPDWTRFAAQANEFIAHQPVPDTSKIVDQAVGQINEILRLSSPQARLARDVQMQQLTTMRDVYNDFKAHPEKYQMTAHGPVMIDPYARMERIARIRHTAASTDYLNRKTQGSGTGNFIKEKLDRLRNAIQYDASGGKLSRGEAPRVEPVPNQPAASEASTAAVDTADQVALGDTGGVESSDAINNPFEPVPYDGQ